MWYCTCLSPCVTVVVDKLFETYGLFSDRNNTTGKVTSSSSSSSSSGGGGGGLGSIDRDERSESSLIGLGTNGGTQAGLRSFTLRDLMKVARRCASHSKDFNVVSGMLTDGLRCRLLSEVTDVFAASIRGRERQRGMFDELVHALGRCWGVAACDVDGEVLHSHPQLHLNTPSDTVSIVDVGAGGGTGHRQNTVLASSTQCLVSVIGRITLITTNNNSTTTKTTSSSGSSSSSSLATAAATAPSFLQQYAFNRHSLRMLEQLAACVSMDEPVLLVGETGSGKTSAVQVNPLL